MLPVAPPNAELPSGCPLNKDTNSYLPIDIMLGEVDGVKILHTHNQECVNSGLAPEPIPEGVADGFLKSLLLYVPAGNKK